MEIEYRAAVPADMAAAMLAEFEKWAAARGAEGILVPCGREGFYEKMGFEMFPVKRYWKELCRNAAGAGDAVQL